MFCGASGGNTPTIAVRDDDCWPDRKTHELGPMAIPSGSDRRHQTRGAPRWRSQIRTREPRIDRDRFDGRDFKSLAELELIKN